MTDTLQKYLMANDDIVVTSVILLFILFTFVLYRSRMIFLYKINTFFSSRQTYAADEISTSNEEFIDIALLIVIGCLSVSSIFYNNIIMHADTGSEYGTLMLMFVGVLLLVGLKGVLYSLVNWTFFSSERSRNWLSAYFFSVAVVATLAFPIALLSIFGNTWTALTNCIIGIIILQKILLLCKLYVNFRPKGYGSLLFFLYFCSVEITPTLMAWHLLSE